MIQDDLRQQTRLAKALNTEYSYKDFAAAIDLSEGSFYNWLAGKYKLSSKKAAQLQDIVVNLIE